MEVGEMEATERLVVSCVSVSPQDPHWCSRKAYILMAVSLVNTPINRLGQSRGSSRPAWNVERTCVLRVTCRIHSNRVIIAQYNCKRMNKLENLFLVCRWLTLWHGQPLLLFWFSCLICSKKKKMACLKSILKFLWKEVYKCKVLLFFIRVRVWFSFMLCSQSTDVSVVLIDELQNTSMSFCSTALITVWHIFVLTPKYVSKIDLINTIELPN